LLYNKLYNLLYNKSTTDPQQIEVMEFALKKARKDVKTTQKTTAGDGAVTCHGRLNYRLNKTLVQ